MARRPFNRRYPIPIYDCNLWVVISDDIYKEREKLNDTFGTVDREYGALCSYDNYGNVGLFFQRRFIADEDTIAHEIFHATHRILEWAGCNFDPQHHEQGALLCGYLSKLVRGAIAQDKKRR